MNDLLFILSMLPTSFRFVVLLFNCLQTFGIYFCYDLPSALQDQFQGVGQGRPLPAGRIEPYLLIPSHARPPVSAQNLTCPNATEEGGTVACVLGLGMTPQHYNLLFAVHSWA